MMKEITSAQNPVIKHLIKLEKNTKYRKEHHTVLIEGKKLISEVCANRPAIRILTTDPHLVDAEADEILLIPPFLLEKISGVRTPEGIIAEIEMPQEHTLSGLSKVIALDGISDPGNIGTLLRTALALGWEGVFFLPGCCDPFNDKAIRAAKGATFRLPQRSGDWTELKKLIEENHWTPIAADIIGTKFNEIPKPQNTLLVLGSESQGLSAEAHQLCEKVTIPMSDDMESLNVSAAGAILMHGLKT